MSPGEIHYESGKHDTTPVGAFSPHGDSPYGAVDIAGNVWEWCHSLFKPYPYQVNDGREDETDKDPRCLRGGSWLSLPKYARCAYRLRHDPGNVLYLVGFRCALSPYS